MKEATAGEYSGLVVAALVLVIVLIAVFMCIQLFYQRKTPSAIVDGSDGFCGGYGGYGEGYSPSCGSNWRQNRYRCGGLTGGAMPSIEGGYACMGRLGCGLLGVPP